MGRGKKQVRMAFRGQYHRSQQQNTLKRIYRISWVFSAQLNNFTDTFSLSLSYVVRALQLVLSHLKILVSSF